jgi:hypothetical protein
VIILLLKATSVMAAVALIVVLVNVLGILEPLPRAFATTCSNTGGDAGGAYYWSQIKPSFGDEYGIQGYINAGSWTYDGDTGGHMATWLDIQINDGTGAHWVQMGLAAGLGGDYNYYSSRFIYYEYSTSTSGGSQWANWSAYQIPADDNDLTMVSAETSSEWYMQTYSTYYNAYFYHSVSSGVVYGQLIAGSETVYSTSEACDGYSNSQTYLGYSTTPSSSPTFYAWPSSSSYYGSGTIIYDPPYSLAYSNYYANWYESGS